MQVTRDSRDSRDDREDSGSEDDSGAKIRVGKDYQVITPNWVPPERKYPWYNYSIRGNYFGSFLLLTMKSKFILHNIVERRPEQCPERALLVWSPNPAISQSKCRFILNSYT